MGFHALIQVEEIKGEGVEVAPAILECLFVSGTAEERRRLKMRLHRKYGLRADQGIHFKEVWGEYVKRALKEQRKHAEAGTPITFSDAWLVVMSRIRGRRRGSV